MAITLDGHEINTLVLKASNGGTVTKQLLEVGGVSVDEWDIYSKGLVETWGKTINLGSDTNFDSLTPTTSGQAISVNNPETKTIPVDLSSYRYMLIREEYIKAAYSGAPAAKAFASHANIAVWLLYLTPALIPQNSARLVINIVRHMQHDGNGSVADAPNGSSYGVYERDGAALDSPVFAATGTLSTTISIGSPGWYMRGSAGYAPVETLEAIDSANSIIKYRYRFYRLPKDTLMQKASDEAMYIIDNDGLRPLT